MRTCLFGPGTVADGECDAHMQLPLYPATTVYLQLMSESRSRINACKAGVGTGVGHR